MTEPADEYAERRMDPANGPSAPIDPAAVVAALCRAIVPGLADDATPGAPEIGAAAFVLHHLGPRAEDLARALLMREPAFLSIDPAIAADLVRRSLDRVPGLREMIALAIASVYGPWSGTEDGVRVVRVPLGWELASYDGPVRGRRPLGA